MPLIEQLPNHSHDQRRDTAACEYSPETAQADQQGSAGVDKNRAEGAAPADPDTGTAVFILGEVAGHNGQKRRPHTGLCKAVDSPQHGEPRWVPEKGNGCVHGCRQQKPKGNDVLWFQTVPHPSAGNLPQSVSDRADILFFV